MRLYTVAAWTCVEAAVTGASHRRDNRGQVLVGGGGGRAYRCTLTRLRWSINQRDNRCSPRPEQGARRERGHHSPLYVATIFDAVEGED